MKKILILLLLSQSISLFSQIDLKLDLYSLSKKRVNIAVEKKIKRIGFEISGEYSFLNPTSTNQTKFTYKPKLGWGGSVRYYLLNFKENQLYIGGVYKYNTQKFFTPDRTFIRKERFAGLLSGFKIKVYKHFYLDAYGAIAYKPYKKFIDLDRKYEVTLTAPYSINSLQNEDIPYSGQLGCSDCNEQPIIGFLANISINYKF